MARFFIDRPVFAWVIAIVIMLAGVLSILTLPVSQYPSIAPPAISITATYPGASAQTLEDSVTQVIEQQMNGLDGLRYMSSTSESNGVATITLTFDNGTDPDTAQMQVQNKLQLATALLPAEVKQQGIQVAKSVRNFLMIVAFVSQRWAPDECRPRRLYGQPGQGPDQSRARCRRDHLLRFPVRHADLARPEPAQSVRAHTRRCGDRHQGGERPDLGGPARRHPGRARPAAQRHGERAEPARPTRGLRRDPAAHPGRRRHGLPARRRARRSSAASNTNIGRHNGKPDVGHGDPAGDRGQCPGHRRGGPRKARRTVGLLPGGDGSASSPTTPRPSCASRSAR